MTVIYLSNKRTKISGEKMNYLPISKKRTMICSPETLINRDKQVPHFFITVFFISHHFIFFLKTVNKIHI